MPDNPPIWIFDLPEFDSRFEGNILLRESDGTVIFWNNETLHVIRDDETQGTLLNSVEIEGIGDIKASISGEFNPIYSYIRARTVSERELDQSSSSSTSSSSSSIDSSSSTSSSSSSSLSSSSSTSSSSTSSSSFSSSSSSSS